MNTASRCDQIIALIDACLADVETPLGKQSGPRNPDARRFNTRATDARVAHI